MGKKQGKVVVEAFIDLSSDPCFGKLWDPSSDECNICGDFANCKKAMDIEKKPTSDKKFSRKDFFKFIKARGGIVKKDEAVKYLLPICGDKKTVRKRLQLMIKRKQLGWSKRDQTFQILTDN